VSRDLDFVLDFTNVPIFSGGTCVEAPLWVEISKGWLEKSLTGGAARALGSREGRGDSCNLSDRSGKYFKNRKEGGIQCSWWEGVKGGRAIGRGRWRGISAGNSPTKAALGKSIHCHWEKKSLKEG